MVTGLFLGAGASYELGMPLVSGLTGEFKGYYTPTHFQELVDGWRKQGGLIDPSVENTIISLLSRSDLHYEGLLGEIETLYNGPSRTLPAQYHYMYTKMLETVYFILYFRHVLNEKYIETGIAPFTALKEFAARSTPFFVFSLNHDIIFWKLFLRSAVFP